MKRYNIMFRNGDGVSLKADVLRDDKMFVFLWKNEKMIAAFSWDAIVGFTITEEVGDEKSPKGTD